MDKKIPTSTTTSSIIFFSEDPPLKKKGHGLSVLLYNMLSGLKKYRPTVVTFTPSTTITRSDIVDDAHWEVLLCDNKLHKATKIRFFTSAMFPVRLLNFLLYLPAIIKLARQQPASPVLVSVGASAKPLVFAALLKKFIPNPVWLYIVDDFEKINELSTNKLERYLTSKFTQPVLKSADRVIVISEGLRQVYKQRHIITADVLLPCFAAIDANLQKIPTGSNVFTFVYTGGLNLLYNDTLKLFADKLQELNSYGSRQYKLIIQTYSSREQFDSLQFDKSVVVYSTSAERSSSLPSYREADCFLVPYTFEAVKQDLVQTSFPQKVAELIQLKRPILFLGPSYSSVIRFFREQQVPYVVDEQNLSSLPEIIEQLATSETHQALQENYSRIYRDHFSEVNVKRVLFDEQMQSQL
ncbi:glycosyltransferase family protein [Pontibacter pudoricolor]|uniref:glycosyltransferase family 4 protein n=1 Tax=Pontibacter pudoricolor TaxID=2694930 RepID=UPI001391C172|nr:glycosyltransferase family 4 protein [Pontibacter pudoricolor]